MCGSEGLVGWGLWHCDASTLMKTEGSGVPIRLSALYSYGLL